MRKCYNSVTSAPLWIRRAKIVSLWGFLILSGCASFTWDFVDTLPRSADGQTTCKGGRPFVEIRKGLEGSWLESVKTHEMMHVRQIQREKSCGTFMAKYQLSQTFRLDTEAEAFCKSLYPVAHDKRLAYGMIVVLLTTNYQVGRVERVDSVVRRYCR